MKSWGCRQLDGQVTPNRAPWKWAMSHGCAQRLLSRQARARTPRGSRFPDKPGFPWKGMDKVRGSGFLGCWPLQAVPRLASLCTWLLLAAPRGLFTAPFPDPSVI